MHRDYSFFTTRDLTPEAYMDIVGNAMQFFRENGKEPARYPVPMLFQATAFFERLATMSMQAQREVPPRELLDEEFYTKEFADNLDFFTEEFIAACDACTPVMDAVHSIAPSVASIAACFLNHFNCPPERQVAATPLAARRQVVQHALELALVHSIVPWTQDMHDRLVAWHAPALLLCPAQNIPPMVSPAMRAALDLAMTLEDQPLRRFNTMQGLFAPMVSPSAEAHPSIPLPDGLSL